MFLPLLLFGTAALGAAAAAERPFINIVKTVNNSDIRECRLADIFQTVMCARVDVDFDAIREDDEFYFNGTRFKKNETMEPERMGVALYSFMSDTESEAFAVFIVRKSPDGHVDIDGNIRMPNKGHMFAIETCGRHCEVLVEYTEAPKTPIQREVEDVRASLPKKSSKLLSTRSEDRFWVNPACVDYLDFSACAAMANFQLCIGMNVVSAFGIPMPCEATCGHCCGNSNYPACWLVALSIVGCVAFPTQCKASCLTCWVPVTG